MRNRTAELVIGVARKFDEDELVMCATCGVSAAPHEPNGELCDWFRHTAKAFARATSHRRVSVFRA